MKKRIFASILILCLTAASLTGCGGTTKSTGTGANGTEVSGNEMEYPKVTLKMTVNGTDIATDTKTAQKFSELVSEASGGNVTIKVYANDQLAGGNMTKGVEMITQGSTDLAAYATSVICVLDEKLLVGTIPWIFDNYTQARETIDSTGSSYYEKILANKGITYMGSVHNGFRQISNSKHAVKTPEDVKGLKIRVPGGEVYLDFFKSFGADPVAMSWGEVFTALQQGTIDGQENGLSVTNSANVYEIQKYMTIWNYTYENYLFVANSKKFESLTSETQALLREKALEACEWGRDLVEEQEEELKQKFKDAGVEITELTEEELIPFKEVVAPLQEKFKQKYGEEACTAFGL